MSKVNANQYRKNGHNFVNRKNEILDVEVMHEKLHLWPEDCGDGQLRASARCTVERTPSINRAVHQSLMCLNIIEKRDTNDETGVLFVDHRMESDGTTPHLEHTPLLPFFLERDKCTKVGKRV